MRLDLLMSRALGELAESGANQRRPAPSAPGPFNELIRQLRQANAESAAVWPAAVVEVSTACPSTPPASAT